MSPFFITHFDHQNLIDTEYIKNFLIIIIPLTFFIIISTFGRKSDIESVPGSKDIFSRHCTLTLRGIAIILLIFGHFTQHCAKGILEVLSYRITGNAAVMTFLLLSGIGLVKTYGMDGPGKRFFISRFRKIYIPLWLTLTLFFSLNFLLIGIMPTLRGVALNYVGILRSGLPNAPTWFITYILIQYGLYYLSTKFPATNMIKAVFLVLLSYMTIICIMVFNLYDDAFWWIEYTLVFPMGIILGLYRHKLFEIIDSLYKRNTILFNIILVLVVMHHYDGTGIYRISNLFQLKLYNYVVSATINPISFFIMFVMISYLIEISLVGSRLLKKLGEYSYEIYLLHFPFMVYYDFLLFRRPLVIYFYLYIFIIVLMGFYLRKATNVIDNYIFIKKGDAGILKIA